ncbi:YfiR family protein [Sphingomonas sp. MMS24-J13]|uniref:YfiR family protein n=1 Tax=Sphingomonas sp. MMS24-J13 TaxID=3238686 RepID=UPI0038512809
MLLLVAIALAMSPPGYKPVSTPIADGAAEQAVADMLTGIASFTRWPTPHMPLRLCLAGVARFVTKTPNSLLNQELLVRALPPSIAAGQIADQCDIVYLGALAPAPAARLLAATRNAPILTIAEDDPACRSGAMFCLQVGPGRTSFELNLDAVSRGGVTIDPRVLRLSREAHR